MKRPTGITGIAILSFVLSFFMMIFEIVMISLNITKESKDVAGLIMPAVVVIIMVMSGIGLLRGRRWGWWLASIITVYMVVAGIIMIITPLFSKKYMFEMIIRAPFVIGFAIAVILTLCNSKSTEYFGFSVEDRRKALKILRIITPGIFVISLIINIINR